ASVPAGRDLSQRLPDRPLAGADRHRDPGRPDFDRRPVARDRYRSGPRSRASPGRVRDGMVMKRFAFFLLLAACNKPSEESCKKAIENMRKLMDTASVTQDIEPYVRRCRGGSTKEA